MPDPDRPAAARSGAWPPTRAVVPWHRYKFATALPAAEPRARASPPLRRVETGARHGNDRPTWMAVADGADRWAFLAWHRGWAVRTP